MNIDLRGHQLKADIKIKNDQKNWDESVSSEE